MVTARRPAVRGAFDVGTRVRVKSHVMDPDFPEVPLGGCAGEIADVHNGTDRYCLVALSPAAFKGFDPALRDRCEQDDRCFDRIWLLEADLEPET